jgi:LPXTG-motif cell wall-anchored protein
MKKNHFYLAAIGLFILAAGFIVVKYKKEEQRLPFFTP